MHLPKHALCCLLCLWHAITLVSGQAQSGTDAHTSSSSSGDASVSPTSHAVHKVDRPAASKIRADLAARREVHRASRIRAALAQDDVHPVDSANVLTAAHEHYSKKRKLTNLNWYDPALLVYYTEDELRAMHAVKRDRRIRFVEPEKPYVVKDRQGRLMLDPFGRTNANMVDQIRESKRETTYGRRVRARENAPKPEPRRPVPDHMVAALLRQDHDESTIPQRARQLLQHFREKQRRVLEYRLGRGRTLTEEELKTLDRLRLQTPDLFIPNLNHRLEQRQREANGEVRRKPGRPPKQWPERAAEMRKILSRPEHSGHADTSAVNTPESEPSSKPVKATRKRRPDHYRERVMRVFAAEPDDLYMMKLGSRPGAGYNYAPNSESWTNAEWIAWQFCRQKISRFRLEGYMRSKKILQIGLHPFLTSPLRQPSKGPQGQLVYDLDWSGPDGPQRAKRFRYGHGRRKRYRGKSSKNGEEPESRPEGSSPKADCTDDVLETTPQPLDEQTASSPLGPGFHGVTLIDILENGRDLSKPRPKDSESDSTAMSYNHQWSSSSDESTSQPNAYRCRHGLCRHMSPPPFTLPRI